MGVKLKAPAAVLLICCMHFVCECVRYNNCFFFSPSFYGAVIARRGKSALQKLTRVQFEFFVQILYKRAVNLQALKINYYFFIHEFRILWKYLKHTFRRI